MQTDRKGILRSGGFENEGYPQCAYRRRPVSSISLAIRTTIARMMNQGKRIRLQCISVVQSRPIFIPWTGVAS